MTDLRASIDSSLADRYQVEHELGRGGMASVWLALDMRHDRKVAIKVLHPDLAGAIGVDRFIREIRLTAKLQHPNVIPVLDSGKIDFDGVVLPWYAMSYVQGESLRARMDRERLLPIDDTVSIVQETSAALKAAHDQGIIHRDIKPENILLADGHAYVADFGIAKALIDTGGEQLTSTGVAIGTAAYMSPEQSVSDIVDARTDQYSLATVVYEMLSGETPFTGFNPQAIIGRRIAEPARSMRPIRASVPPHIEAAVLKGLERVPADRFDDIGMFARAVREPGSQQIQQTSGRPNTVFIATAAIVLIAISAWIVSRYEPSPAKSTQSRVDELYRRGKDGYDKRTPSGVNEAIISFSSAVQVDSSYAPAWNGLAASYVRAYERHFTIEDLRPDSILRLAVTAVDRAVSLEPGNTDALTTQGLVNRIIDPTDVAPAIRSARRALKADSTNVVAWHVLGISLAESGDFDGALDAWRHSIRRDPPYTQGLAFLGLAYYWLRKYDSAAYWADSAVSVDPNYLLGRTTAGSIELERRNVSKARAHFEAARRLTSDVELINSLYGMAQGEARGGRMEAARSIVSRADSTAFTYSPIPIHTSLFGAQAHVAIGDNIGAIRLLKRYEPAEDLHFQLHLRCDPPFDPIRSDSSFAALLIKSATVYPHDCPSSLRR